ncbi:hypothetical protein [Kocuria aegyptia]|uniref:Uncharacterized protein n=1 Tax=Kocuria aegyptia TaxID=330943 RepID=A0ABP4X0E3_9MICC
MRFLPAVAALIAMTVAVISVVRGDWGVVVISAVLCAVAVRAQLLIRRGAASDPGSREEP